jgi:hypothetical protein
MQSEFTSGKNHSNAVTILDSETECFKLEAGMNYMNFIETFHMVSQRQYVAKLGVL